MNQPPKDLPPRVVGSRGAERKRALLSGRVTSRDGSIALECTVRDLSESGARITISRGRYIPTRVYLVHSRSPEAYEAEVTWIKAPQYGLKFTGMMPLDDTLPAKLSFLKKVDL